MKGGYFDDPWTKGCEAEFQSLIRYNERHAEERFLSDKGEREWLEWNKKYLAAQRQRILVERDRTHADSPNFISDEEVAEMLKGLFGDAKPHEPPKLLSEDELKILYPDEPHPLRQGRLHILQQAAISGRLAKR